MADPLMVVEVQESPIYVSPDTDTYIVTVADTGDTAKVASTDIGDTTKIIITDLGDVTKVTTIDADPVDVVIANGQPTVNVNLGSGNTMDPSLIMDLLGGKLDTAQFSTEMQSDIFLMRDLWSRVGRNLDQLLTELDVDRVVRMGTEYTDTLAKTTAIDIARVDGRINANESVISQTAQEIGLRVSDLDYKNTQEFTAQSSRIDLNSNEIASQVTRVDSLESGVIFQAQSDIVQTASQISAEVVAREALASGVVSENTSKITQTADALVVNIAATDGLTGRVDSAEFRMTATEAVTTILSEGIKDSQYSLKAVESLTTDRYGVVLEEDVGGEKYISSFEMVIHPVWLVSAFPYNSGNVVSYSDGKVYKCILAHLSTVANSPGSIAWATYWELAADSAKSAFNIRADSFQVITPDGLKPVFVVDAANSEVTINGDLVVTTIKSTDYDAQQPGDSWFILDPTTGQAEFNNMKMTFGSNTAKTAFQSEAGFSDGATNDADIRYPGDSSSIDGGKIHAGSVISIGDVAGGNYCSIDKGDIDFWKVFNGAPVIHKSLKRLEAGPVSSDEVKTIPGYFSSQPKVMVAPVNLPIYRQNYANQDQALQISPGEVVRDTVAGEGKWKFTPTCQLVLDGSTASGLMNMYHPATITRFTYPVLTYPDITISHYETGPEFVLPANVISVTVNISLYFRGYWYLKYGDNYWTGSMKVKLHVKRGGGWYSGNYSSLEPVNGWRHLALTLNTWEGLNPDAGVITAVRLFVYFTDSTYHSDTDWVRYSDYQMNMLSYTAILDGQTIIASGDLNYIAIGE